MNIRWLMAAALIFTSTGVRGDEDMPANQEAKIFTRKFSREVEMSYLLFLPEGYKTDTTKRWPLMLFLHGSGERGSNLSKVAVHGPPKLVQSRKDFPFILVSPQCPAGEVWSDEALLALLDQVQAELRVDTNRVYLTGLSMGGFGTWSLGLKNPARFAAIVPICGGAGLLDVILCPPRKLAALKRLPIWAFHGAKDSVVPPSESETIVEELKKAGNGNVKLTVYPEAGHDSWSEAYNNPELYEWLLQQTLERKSARRTIQKRSEDL